jgi:formylglycine-generating enzyme required for sulfatase activity
MSKKGRKRNEHERIHLETSSVLMRELPAHLVIRPSQFAKYHPSAFDCSAKRVIQNQMLRVEGGEVKLGKPRDWRSFGWDNEYGTRTAKVEPFAASKFLITNGEFLEFVRSGGYGNKAYWTEAGWQWRVFRNIHFPTFWCPDGPVRCPSSPSRMRACVLSACSCRGMLVSCLLVYACV